LQLPYYYTEALCDLDILPRTLPEICCRPAPGICCRRAGTAARTDHAVQYCVPGLVQAHPATVRCGPKRLMGAVQQLRYCIFAWAVASVASLSRCSPRREKRERKTIGPQNASTRGRQQNVSLDRMDLSYILRSISPAKAAVVPGYYEM
jgi:hypothetical protein